MIAEVIVDVANSEVDKIFDYIAIPDVSIGDRVLVPFGRRTIEGYVINLKDKSNQFNHCNIVLLLVQNNKNLYRLFNNYHNLEMR